MRKSLSVVVFLGFAGFLPAQITGGHETVQDAIRFERQKDAASARQARIDAQNSSANRSATESTARSGHRARHKGKGSAARSSSGEQMQQQQQPPKQ